MIYTGFFYLLLIPYSLLPTPYSLLPTPYSLLPTPCSLKPRTFYLNQLIYIYFFHNILKFKFSWLRQGPCTQLLSQF
ncbi:MULTISPECIES: hypothetical protein [unclassified Moorena]|uniref:hypothetical protein n=1 Tax=unclassified Moorena TaxID=2683338 RepID=UPI0025E5F5F0|nr:MULTISPECIES: hypothetical protein [unclassified Moorena]